MINMSLLVKGRHVPRVLATCAILGLSGYYLVGKMVPTRLDITKAPGSIMGLVEAYPCSDIVCETCAEHAPPIRSLLPIISIIFIHGLG